MPNSDLSTLRQTLSADAFDQLRNLIQQTAHSLKGHILLTTEQLFTHAHATRPEQFTVVVSSSFSALLVGELIPDDRSPCSTYSIHLTFEPEAIVAFLNQLVNHCTAKSTIKKLKQASTIPQGNDATLQTHFTLQLIALLQTASHLKSQNGYCKLIEPALVQQIEQERLLNHLTAQIRQSLELPVILQTAVDQVQAYLQMDRLVIYQLHPSVEPIRSVADDTYSQPEWIARSGIIAYEAKASAAIPSVLHLSEACCFAQSLQGQDKYRQGTIVAVEDVEVRYEAVPCLLKFLHLAQVRAKLIVPILVQQELWGFLIAHHCHEPRRWEDSEQRFLKQIAEHLAIAINQAQLYAEVHQQKQTLEQRVVERTQELHDALLTAQSANKAKSEFLAAVSHELRTPLTCVIGMSATLLRWSPANLSDRQISFLRTIHESGEQLLELINNILNFSQLEAGKAVLTLSEFSLGSLAQQSIQALREKAALKGVDLMLDVRVDGKRDRFLADSPRVRQILINLLSNAIKFTPQGGKVTLRVFADDHQAVFQVKDTGIGIPEHKRPLLFQKFQQLDSSYQREYEGTGLGLALTKQLVDLHQGAIEVESTVGVGSIFTVKLPRQKGKSLSPARNPKGTELSSNATAVINPRCPLGRVVLIEEHEDTANIICDILTVAGYQLVWMLEGATAVNQIELLQPIAIISDLQLPDRDGFDFIRQLRQNPATKKLKILAIGSHPGSNLRDEQKRSLAAGADGYLPKPVHPDQILTTLIALTTE